MPKQQIIAASEARNNFSDLVSKVQYKGETFLIERYGEVVAKIVPVQTEENKLETRESSAETVSEQQQNTQINQNDQSDNTQEVVEKQPDSDFLSTMATQSSYRQVSAMGRTTSMPPRIIRDEQIEHEKQDEPVTQTTRENDSGWSALKKLEELIAAQKAKSEAERQPVQTQDTPPSLGDRLRWGSSINRSTAQYRQENMDDDQEEGVEIIRKKIDL